MPGPVVLKNAVDSFTNQAAGQTGTNYNQQSRLMCRTGGAGDLRSFIYFSRPFPLGSTIIDATLRLYAKTTGWTAITITVTRIGTEWSVNKIKGSLQPTVVGTPVTFGPFTVANGAEIAIPITSILQDVSNGGAWFGVRITATGTGSKELHSAQSASVSKRPTLSVTWSDKPAAPTVLSPSGNRALDAGGALLTFDYVDPGADTPLAAVQVQVDPAANWTAPAFDSGTFLTSLPQYMLDGDMIPNQGADVDVTTHWTGSGATVARDTGIFNTGPASFALTATTTAPILITGATNQIPVSPGKTYTFSAYARYGATVHNWTISVFYYKADGTASTVNASDVSASTALTTAFVQKSLTTTVPSDAAFMRPRVSMISAVAGDVFYVDDIHMTLVGAPPLTEGQSTWWRVRVQDASGKWSDWSHTVNGTGAQYQRRAKGTLGINNPAVSPNNFVWDPTPPIDWTFSLTQRHYQVIITKPSNSTVIIWTTGKITGIETSVTLPEGVLTDVGDTYRVIVRVWDTFDREQNGAITPYVQAIQDFTFNYDATVTGVSAFTVVADPAGTPASVLSWTRATQPDEWNITRDNKVIDKGLGSDFFVSGTTYTYIDRTPVGRTLNTYKVMASVNKRQSSVNPTASITPAVAYPWLMRPDGTDVVTFLNPKRDMAYLNDQEVHELVADVPPVVITQSLSGYAGHVEGLLTDEGGPSTLSAKQQRDNLKDIRLTPGVELILMIADESMYVTAFNITWQPDTTPSKVYYWASFDWVQTRY